MHVLKTTEGHESSLIAPGSETILQSKADQNRQVCAQPVNLFHTLLFQIHKGRPDLFFSFFFLFFLFLFYLSSNLTDFSTLIAESGRYCLPFFSLYRSDSNQTLRSIVPLLPRLLVNSGSEASAYIVPISLDMGRLTGGGSAGQGSFTGTQRSGEKARSLVKD